MYLGHIFRKVHQIEDGVHQYTNVGSGYFIDNVQMLGNLAFRAPIAMRECRRIDTLARILNRHPYSDIVPRET